VNYTKTVKDAFELANTDKGYYHNYEHMYAMLFAFFEPKTLLEIGVKNGLSIWAWQTLFPNCDITGIDIQKSFDMYNKGPFNYLIGDSTTYNVSSLPTYDIIIEDGSHDVVDQIKTFQNFKDKFKYYYVIEDINFVKGNDPTSDKPLKDLIAAIQAEGFYGIATYPSYNKRKDTRALVVMSKSF